MIFALKTKIDIRQNSIDARGFKKKFTSVGFYVT